MTGLKKFHINDSFLIFVVSFSSFLSAEESWGPVDAIRPRESKAATLTYVPTSTSYFGAIIETFSNFFGLNNDNAQKNYKSTG